MRKESDKLVDFQSLKERLKGHGLKISAQRLIIFQELLKKDDHPSADIIYDRVKAHNPGISLATVYKTLDSLVSAGLAKKVNTADGLNRFDAKTDQHSHLYCTNTNEIIDFEDDELNVLLKNYFAQKDFANFKVTDFQLQINGEMSTGTKKLKLKQSK